jgi:pimeloyl-ACP methyl ester carboxylesterase
MRATLTFSILVFSALLAFAWPDLGGAATPTADFEPAPCVDMAQAVDTVDPSRLLCGFVEVEETRGDGDSRTLRLAVLVLRAISPTPQPDPVVFLTGGPGQAAVDGALIGWGDPYFSGALQQDRDLVFYDHRGTGQSGALDCPEADQVDIDELLEGLTGEEYEARFTQALTECRDRYLADGADLDAYDSAASAQDIVDVMTALGYEEWNLYGVSYGTHLALTALRDTEGVRTVILDSTSPPEVNSGVERARTFENTLDALFSACEESATCAQAYPNFEEEFWANVARANADPIEVEIEAPGGTRVTIAIDGDTLLNGTFQAMYDPTTIPVLPFVTQDIAAGNTGILTIVAQQLVFLDYGISTGMFWSVLCNEEIPFYTEELLAQANVGVRPELIAASIDANNPESLAYQQRICAIFDLAPPPAIDNRAVVSDVPALVLAGRFDPTTPTEYSRLAASNLSNSYYFEFPSQAHAVDFYVPECAGPLAAAFLANPDEQPDGSCVDDYPEVAWVLPEEEPPPAEPTPTPTPTPATGAIMPPNTGTGVAANDLTRTLIAAAALGAAGSALLAVAYRRQRLRM